MTTAEAAAWVALRAVPGVGDRVGHRLLERFGSPDAVLRATPGALTAAGLPPALARRLVAGRGAPDAREEARRILAAGARLVPSRDGEYPLALRQLGDAPLYLVARGRRLAPGPAVAVVGARAATPYGRDVAGALAEDLARAGVTVVSGLARGIDVAAHEGALRGGGPTVAVLGTGVDRVYPPEHAGLAEEITRTGTLVSERPMGALPLPHHFPARNRIIAGMTCGTVVVEAGARSGALITARVAVDAGREVFAVPGRIDSRASTGPHALILQGAKLVRGVHDVLDELGPALAGAEPSVAPSPEDDPLLACLAGGPLSTDRLAAASGLAIADVQARALDLELRGLVRYGPGALVTLTTRLPAPADSGRGGGSPPIGE